MDFSNFFIPYVLDVKEAVFRSFTRPLISGNLENKSQLPVLQELEGTDGWVMNFRYFFNPYIFEVKESISRSFTKLPCSGDLENLGQLPGSEVLQLQGILSIWFYGFQ